MAVPLDWSVRISDMEALLVARQTELGQQLQAKAALEAVVEMMRQQQEAALLEVLQLRTRDAAASLKLAQTRKLLAESASDSTCAAEVPRLENRHSNLQTKMQMLRQAQQRERQIMQEFSLLAEEHVNAAAAPLQDARQALEQAHHRLRNSKQLAQHAMEAECVQLDADAKTLAEEQQAAMNRLEDVQAENKALQRMIGGQRVANTSRAQKYRQAANAEAAKTRTLHIRLEGLQRESQRLTAEERDLEHKLEECRASLLEMSAVT